MERRATHRVPGPGPTKQGQRLAGLATSIRGLAVGVPAVCVEGVHGSGKSRKEEEGYGRKQKEEKCHLVCL